MSGDLQVYSIDPSSGALTMRSMVSAPAAAGNALITPDGRFLYDTTPTGIYEFSIDAVTGALTQLAGSPVAYTIVPGPGAIHPSGKFLYITNADPSVTSNAQLSAWSIDSQTGALTAIALSPAAVTAAQQLSVTIDGSGQFAIVTTAASDSAGCYYEAAIDASTGLLTPLPGVGTAVECGPMVADASYNFLYGGSSGVAVYLLNQQGVPQFISAGVLRGPACDVHRCGALSGAVHFSRRSRSVARSSYHIAFKMPNASASPSPKIHAKYHIVLSAQ